MLLQVKSYLKMSDLITRLGEYIIDGILDLSPSQTKTLVSEYGIDNISSAVATLDLVYPTKVLLSGKTSTELADVYWNNLIGYEQTRHPEPNRVSLAFPTTKTDLFDWETFIHKDRKIVFTVTPVDWELYDELSKCFSEVAKSRAVKKRSSFSMMTAWTQDREASCTNLLTSSNLALSSANLKEVQWRRGFEVTGDRPHNVRAIIDLFGASTVLDPCGGWGDRMIGAALSNATEYHCIDPNTGLESSYSEMQKYLKTKRDFKLTYEINTFEDAKIPTEYYDLIITAPPAFDNERYSAERTQSVKNGMSFEDWYGEFLIPFVDKCCESLKFGGFMVLSLAEYGLQPYVEALTLYLHGWKLNFCGIIHTTRTNNSGCYVPRYVYGKPTYKFPYACRNIYRSAYSKYWSTLAARTKQTTLKNMMKTARKHRACDKDYVFVN